MVNPSTHLQVYLYYSWVEYFCKYLSTSTSAFYLYLSKSTSILQLFFNWYIFLFQNRNCQYITRNTVLVLNRMLRWMDDTVDEHGVDKYFIMGCTHHVTVPKYSYSFYMAQRLLTWSWFIVTILGTTVPELIVIYYNSIWPCLAVRPLLRSRLNTVTYLCRSMCAVLGHA